MYGLPSFSSLVSRLSVGYLYRVNGSSGLIGVLIASSVSCSPFAFSSLPTSTVSFSSSVLIGVGVGVAVIIGSAVALLGFFAPRLENSVRSITGVGSLSFPVSLAEFVVLSSSVLSLVCPSSMPVVSLSVFDSLSVTISEALPVKLFMGLNIRRTHVMVCLLTNVSNAIAVKNKTAVSPGGPITFSVKSTQTDPW